MHTHLVVSLLAPMKVAGAEGKPDDDCVAAGVEEHARNGNDSGNAQRLNNMAKPVKVLVNVVPGDFHRADSTTPSLRSEQQLTLN